MKLLVDTNVVIDYAARRHPFFESASLLMGLGYIREFELWMSASQVTDVFYILSEGGRHDRVEGAKTAVKKLRESVRVCSCTELDMDDALGMGWSDFEDACVCTAAMKIKADAIITRNQRDFAKSPVKVFDCPGLFAWMEREKGIMYGEVPL